MSLRPMSLLLAAAVLAGCAPTLATTQHASLVSTHRVTARYVFYSVDDLVAAGYARSVSLDLTDGPPFYVLVADAWTCRVSATAYTEAARTDAQVSCRWLPRSVRSR